MNMYNGTCSISIVTHARVLDIPETSDGALCHCLIPHTWTRPLHSSGPPLGRIAASKTADEQEREVRAATVGSHRLCSTMQGSAPAEQVGRAGQGVHTGAGWHKAAVSSGNKHSVSRAHAIKQPQQLQVLELTDVAQEPQHRTHLVYVQRRTPQRPPQSLYII